MIIQKTEQENGITARWRFIPVGIREEQDTIRASGSLKLLLNPILSTGL